MRETVQKPWGEYTDILRRRDIVFKEIVVAPGQRLSLQSHRLREEFWYWQSGKGLAIVGSSRFPLEATREVRVPRGVRHRIVNTGDVPLRLLEYQIGVCSELDIVRYQDDYHRK